MEMCVSATPIMIIPFMLFSGFLINIKQIPEAIAWLGYTSPFKYGYAALMQNEYQDLNINCMDCPPNDFDCVPCDPIDDMNFTEPLWFNVVMLIVLILVFRVLAALALQQFVTKIGS